MLSFAVSYKGICPSSMFDVLFASFSDRSIKSDVILNMLINWREFLKMRNVKDCASEIEKFALAALNEFVYIK